MALVQLKRELRNKDFNSITEHISFRSPIIFLHSNTPHEIKWNGIPNNDTPIHPKTIFPIQHDRLIFCLKYVI